MDQTELAKSYNFGIITRGENVTDINSVHSFVLKSLLICVILNVLVSA